MKFKNAYSPTNDPGISFPSQGRTKQSFKEECDVNNILKRYNKTGQLPDMIKANPKYGDFSHPFDYQESLNVIKMATQQFDALPAKVRERFNNDPEKFLEFTANKDNAPEMIRMGLATGVKKTPVEKETAPKTDKTGDFNKPNKSVKTPPIPKDED